MRVFNLLCILLLKFYKNCISPFLPRACRFEPTCSVYALECMKTFSFFKAVYLTAKRIFRCHPFCNGGYDPVPDLKQR